MKVVYTCMILLLFPFFSFSQPKSYEIFGNIKGDYMGKVHLIFDKITATNDSLIAEINDGKFFFKGTVPKMPILAIFRLSEHSTFARVYIDGPATHIDFTNKLNVQENYSGQLFTVAAVRGSETSSLLMDFERKQQEINNSALLNDDRRQVLNDQLSSFIKQHPKKIISAYLLSQASGLSYKEAKANSALLDGSLHNSTEWTNVQRMLNDLYKPQYINTLFYDVVLKDQNNHAVETKTLKGNLTLIVLWASWCAPCRVEHPDLKRYYANYKNKGLQIVGISLDKSKEAWIKAIEKDKLTWPQLIDGKTYEGELVKYYGIEAVPSNFLLDQNRKIIGVDLSLKEMEEMIGRLLP